MEKIIKLSIIFIISVALSVLITVYATTTIQASQVSYDNTNSSLTTSTSEAAIDELYTKSTQIICSMYPVGSIYISTNSTLPTLVNSCGTWSAFGGGRVLVGMGNNGTTNYTTVEEKLGTESEKYTPSGTNGLPSGVTSLIGKTTLSVDQLPAISGRLDAYAGNSSSGLGIFISSLGNLNSGYFSTSYDVAKFPKPSSTGWANSSSNKPYGTATFSFGGNGSHNHPFTQPTFTGTEATISHIQPYTVVYMWKRTS